MTNTKSVPKLVNRTPKTMVTFRLSDEGRSLIQTLCVKLGFDKTEVMEEAIRVFARAHRVEWKPDKSADKSP